MYLQNNPYSSDGSVHLKEYVSSPVLNPDVYTADTEQPSQIDLDIAQIQDPGEQANRRWGRYLAGLSVWKANMDIQYILDPYACVMYVASYMMKSEESMGDLLKQVSNESSSQEIQDQLRFLGSVFLTHRELCAQEAVYRILSLPLKHLSRKVVNINTDPKPERVVILKKQTVLEV